MYIQDLASYNYDLPKDLVNVIAVGWLAKGHSFTTGQPPVGFIDNLKKIVTYEHVNQMRGTHSCDFCNSGDIKLCHENQSILLGAAEIWIPDLEKHIIFAAPNLVYHYVLEHNYLPPQCFIEAIQLFRADGNWDGQSKYEELMKTVYPDS